MRPLVSIGVPSYNCSAFILETLESVKKQTYHAIELIIIDDCSTDDSVEKITNWIAESGLTQVRFFCNDQNFGLVKTCNLLLGEFTGKYYMILGADDILLCAKIEKQVEIFENTSDSLALIYSDVQVINEEGVVIQQSFFDRVGLNVIPHETIFSSLLNFNFIPALSVLIRTSAAKEIGGYDEQLSYEDWDMWLRLTKSYSSHCMKESTGFYRVRTGSIMHVPKNAQRINRSILLMLKKYVGDNSVDQKFIQIKIEERTIYSYYKEDPESTDNLLWCLNRRIRFKILFYYLLSVARIQLRFKG